MIWFFATSLSENKSMWLSWRGLGMCYISAQVYMLREQPVSIQAPDYEKCWDYLPNIILCRSLQWYATPGVTPIKGNVTPAGPGDGAPLERHRRYSHTGDIYSVGGRSSRRGDVSTVTPAGQGDIPTVEIYCQMRPHWRPVLWLLPQQDRTMQSHWRYIGTAAALETYFVAVTPAGGRDVLTVTPAGQDNNIATLEIYFGCYSSRREIFCWLLLQQDKTTI